MPSTPAIDAVIVGGGFAGLYATHRLRNLLGLRVQSFEAASGPGGTWYWNRYPGARCDIESLWYSYSFDRDLQLEWRWSERFAAQPEILAYLEHVADRFDLRRSYDFNTRVTSLVWSDTDQKFPETRIIFVDAEKSNWAWDPVAQAYYWHRFYAHQPDLNFDNPRGLRW